MFPRVQHALGHRPLANSDDDDGMGINYGDIVADDSLSTLLSDEEYDDDDDDDNHDERQHSDYPNRQRNRRRELPVQRWNRLKSHYKTRDQALQQIARGKTRRFVTLLYEHEYQARERQRQELLLQVLLQQETHAKTVHVSNETKKKKNSLVGQQIRSDHLIQTDRLIKELSKPLVTPVGVCIRRHEAATWLQTLQDMFVFETSTTLPATLSLLVHTLVHASIYEIIQYGIHEARKYLSESSDASVEAYIAVGLFIFGLTLMRLSGYLYWWCNRLDYQSVKFDYHNRSLLGMVDAKCIAWVKRREKLRAACYMFGYDLIYCSVLYIQSRILLYCLDQRKELLANLPSNKYNHDVCLDVLAPEVEGSTYSFDCQRQLELLEQKQDDLQDGDVAYTWNMLSGDSFDIFWSEKGQGMIDYLDEALYSPGWGLACHCLVLAFCVGLLRWYGFTFWEKY